MHVIGGRRQSGLPRIKRIIVDDAIKIDPKHLIPVEDHDKLIKETQEIILRPIKQHDFGFAL